LRLRGGRREGRLLGSRMDSLQKWAGLWMRRGDLPFGTLLA
jgi:hypothetical protein